MKENIRSCFLGPVDLVSRKKGANGFCFWPSQIAIQMAMGFLLRFMNLSIWEASPDIVPKIGIWKCEETILNFLRQHCMFQIRNNLKKTDCTSHVRTTNDCIPQTKNKMEISSIHMQPQTPNLGLHMRITQLNAKSGADSANFGRCWSIMVECGGVKLTVIDCSLLQVTTIDQS